MDTLLALIALFMGTFCLGAWSLMIIWGIVAGWYDVATISYMNALILSSIALLLSIPAMIVGGIAGALMQDE